MNQADQARAEWAEAEAWPRAAQEAWPRADPGEAEVKEQAQEAQRLAPKA